MMANRTALKGVKERYMDDEDPDTIDRMLDSPIHPRTGLNTKGPLNVEDVGIEWQPGNHPVWAQFQYTTPTSRRAMNRRQFIPMAGGQNITTGQPSISASRYHQLLDEPGSEDYGRSARRETPVVFEHQPGRYDMLDGNHRMSSEIAKGAMFVEADVMRSTDRQAVVKQSTKISNAVAKAQKNPRAAHPVVQDARIRRNYGILGLPY